MERKRKCSTGKGIRDYPSGEKDKSRHMKVGKEELSGERHAYNAGERI